ncbi:hypothetical protein GCM10009557_28860 [Virgisporangium ochraceum]|uniref:Uncharacterized protein n=1 Tax=Virgisporangium ochraceum TaxID=65505 RepID=A0A8J3ZY42_9ACTN|nr:hypothetical protein Voc01_066780 [Virgisporangium ochraceum]
MTDSNDTPEELARPGTIRHSWSCHGSIGYVSMRPTSLACRTNRSGKFDDFRRTQFGRPYRETSALYSVPAMPTIEPCLAFSGGV